MFGLNGGKVQKAHMELGPMDKWVLIVVRQGQQSVQQFASPDLPAEEAISMLMGTAANVAITELRAREEYKARIKPPGVVVPQ